MQHHPPNTCSIAWNIVDIQNSYEINEYLQSLGHFNHTNIYIYL